MNIEKLREAIEYAPNLAPAPPAGLLGWWHLDETGDIWVCSVCAGRIMARGVSLRPCESVWADQAVPFGVCVCCATAGAQS